MELKSSILRGIASVYHRVGRSSSDDNDGDNLCMSIMMHAGDNDSSEDEDEDDDNGDDVCWMVMMKMMHAGW